MSITSTIKMYNGTRVGNRIIEVRKDAEYNEVTVILWVRQHNDKKGSMVCSEFFDLGHTKDSKADAEQDIIGCCERHIRENRPSSSQ